MQVLHIEKIKKSLILTFGHKKSLAGIRKAIHKTLLNLWSVTTIKHLNTIIVHFILKVKFIELKL